MARCFGDQRLSKKGQRQTPEASLSLYNGPDLKYYNISNENLSIFMKVEMKMVIYRLDIPENCQSGPVHLHPRLTSILTNS